METILKLGKILEGGEHRDAIHIAVAPVEAAQQLAIGQKVGLKDGRAVATAPHVGIVDPYLTRMVKPGERFYIFLFPYTVTGLRHEWTHPAFGDESAKSVSERWMRAWAIKHVSDDYYAMEADAKVSDEEAYQFALSIGRDNHVGPFEELRDNGELNGEWWHHWETITGMRGDREGGFSCSC